MLGWALHFSLALVKSKEQGFYNIHFSRHEDKL